jgi:hypothetical protein
MNRTIGVGGLVMLLVVALAAVGIGVALWSKVLTIQGVVRTGSVNAEFIEVFTDDDDAVDNREKDSQDTGDCLITVGPESPPLIPEMPEFPDKRVDPGTSCDPAATGRDPKEHYDKDVGRCDAMALPDGRDNEPQPGSQAAAVALSNVYPSYHCTAWFDVQNNGTVPVLLHSVTVQGKPAIPCESGASTVYDLDADTQPDIEICVSELPVCPAGEKCEPQIDPRDVFQFNLDIHVLQTAPQDSILTFTAEACLHQWNEEIGQCPAVPAIEVDTFSSTASILLQDPNGNQETVVLGGPTTVEVMIGPAGEAFDSNGNGLDDVDTEIVQMQLTGNSPLLGPLTLRLRGDTNHPFMRSLGMFEETANTQAGRLDLPPFAPAGTASSFFDVFFEIELPGLGLVLHNDQPQHVSGVISHKPPGPTTSHLSSGPVGLMDTNDNPTGVTILSATYTPVP